MECGISRFGVRLIAKTPNYVNQLGFDIDLVDVSGILANGATSATLTFTSSGDQYYPGALTFATEVFQPILEGHVFKSVVDRNGGAVEPGDTLDYTFMLTNAGQDAATEFVLTDAIPLNATYVPDSLEITTGANKGPKTDAAGDDQAEFTGSSVVFRLGSAADASAGGRLPPNVSTTLRFSVQINPIAAPDTLISNQATTTYNGDTLDTLFTTLSDGDRTVLGQSS